MSSVCGNCGDWHEGDTGPCGSGCDLARRLPRGEAGLPATWQLGVLLAWGFALFNQALFAGMQLLAHARGEPESEGKFALASLAAGCLVAAAGLFFFAIARPKRLSDWQVLLVSAGLGFVGGYRLGTGSGAAHTLGLAIFNLLFFLWLTRGLWTSGASKKDVKGNGRPQ